MFGTSMPAEHIKLFTGAPWARFTSVSGGANFLNATHPREVAAAMLEMLATCA